MQHCRHRGLRVAFAGVCLENACTVAALVA